MQARCQFGSVPEREENVKRCKLVSPTQLLLEHPILSPVDECEYVLHGVKEYHKETLKTFNTGIFLGMAAGIALAVVILMMRFPCLR